MSTETALFHEVEQRDKEFEAAFNAGDMTRFAGLYAEDAKIMPPDSAIISGREAIRGFWQAVRDSGVHGLALHPQTVEDGGDRVIEVGTGELVVDSGSGQSSTVGAKYVVIWKRGRDGQLQLLVDIWNSNPSE